MKEIKCIRCNNTLSPHAVYNALVELKQNGSEFSISEENVLPVIPHICDSCGYVELYVIQSKS